jgi:hypothetical protein
MLMRASGRIREIRRFRVLFVLFEPPGEWRRSVAVHGSFDNIALRACPQRHPVGYLSTLFPRLTCRARHLQAFQICAQYISHCKQSIPSVWPSRTNLFYQWLQERGVILCVNAETNIPAARTIDSTANSSAPLGSQLLNDQKILSGVLFNVFLKLNTVLSTLTHTGEVRQILAK